MKFKLRPESDGLQPVYSFSIGIDFEKNEKTAGEKFMNTILQ